MELQKLKYPRSRSTCLIPMVTIREDYDLKYDEDHNVISVKVGDTDLCKEVQSHANEVGLTNAIKNAIAHGEDPFTKFARSGSSIGLPAIDPNATFDELKEAMNSNDAKYSDIAKTLGITVDELKDAVANGSIGSIIASKAKEVEKEKEGAE